MKREDAPTQIVRTLGLAHRGQTVAMFVFGLVLLVGALVCVMLLPQYRGAWIGVAFGAGLFVGGADGSRRLYLFTKTWVGAYEQMRASYEAQAESGVPTVVFDTTPRRF